MTDDPQRQDSPTEESTGSLSRAEVVTMIEERIRELEADERGEARLSRRDLLGFLGGGAVGVGLSSVARGTSAPDSPSSLSSDGRPSDFEVSDVTTNQLTADRIRATYLNSVRWVDSFDDLQPAIDEVATQTSAGSDIGGAVVLKNKTYDVTEPIVLKHGVALVGQQLNTKNSRGLSGYTQTMLDGSGMPDGAPIIRTVEQPNEEAADNCAVSQVTLTNTGNTAIDGIHIYNVDSPYLYRVNVHRINASDGSGSGTGLHLKGAFDFGVQECSIAGGSHDSGTYGVWIQSDSTTNRNSQGWMNGDFSSWGSGINGSHAIRMESATLKLVGTGYRCHLSTQNQNLTSSDTPRSSLYISGQSEVLMSNTVITGHVDSSRVKHVAGIESHGQLTMSNCVVEKMDRGVYIAERGPFSRITNSRIAMNHGHGVDIQGATPLMAAVDIGGNGRAGIRCGNPNTQNPIGGPLRIADNAEYGLDLGDLSQGSRLVLGTALLQGNGSGAVDAPEHVTIGEAQGYAHTRTGGQTFSGDGSTTRFTVDSFGLDDPAVRATVTADAASDATAIAGVHSDSFSADSFDFEFESAPPSGTNNVTVFYEVDAASAL